MDNSNQEKKPAKMSRGGCLLALGQFVSIILIIILVPLFIYTNISTLNTLIHTGDAPGTRTCSYFGCSNKAQDSVTAALMDSYAPYIRPNSSYSLEFGSYQNYSTRETKDTYLVADSKGLKVENVYGEEKYADGRIHVESIEGYYCAEHTAAGQALIRSEVRRAATWGRPWFQVGVVLIVVPWIFHFILRRKDRKKEAKKA